MSSTLPTYPERRERSPRRRLLFIAGLVALAEAGLVLAGVLDKWLAVGVAAAVLIGYFGLRDRVSSERLRSVIWAAAVSQAAVMLIPAVLAILGWIVLAGIVVAVGAVLLVLLGER